MSIPERITGTDLLEISRLDYLTIDEKARRAGYLTSTTKGPQVDLVEFYLAVRTAELLDQGLSQTQIRSRLRSIEAPNQIMVSDNHQLTLPSELLDMAGFEPGARVLVIPDPEHFEIQLVGMPLLAYRG